jgi:hypothetical protein
MAFGIGLGLKLEGNLDLEDSISDCSSMGINMVMNL